METKIVENSVVQINEKGQKGWIGCFVQVPEVKNWGIQGWIQIPMQEGQAYVRVPWNQFDYIGQAIMTLKKTVENGNETL